MNTSLEKKKELWPAFVAACESQWKCGGKRYALSEDKEFTDLVCEVAGNDWIAGTIVKYVGEILNMKRAGENIPEVDFFKIAVYAFLWWIKERENCTDRDQGEEFSNSNPFEDFHERNAKAGQTLMDNLNAPKLPLHNPPANPHQKVLPPLERAPEPYGSVGCKWPKQRAIREDHSQKIQSGEIDRDE